MESSIIFRIRTDSAERMNLIERCLGADAPVFSDELDPSDRPTFEALEGLFPPEGLDRFDDCGLELNWISGGDLEAEITECCKAFLIGEAHHIVGYYWADEDEGFFCCTAKGLRLIRNWEKRLQEVGIEYSDTFSDDQADECEDEPEFEWISQFLAHLQDVEFG